MTAFSLTFGDIRVEGRDLGLEPLDRGLKFGHCGVVSLRSPFPGVTAEGQFSQAFFEGFKLLTSVDGFGFPLT
jgi:hypothetical protein